MEVSDGTLPERNHHYRWKYWGFPDGHTENPILLKETEHYFKTEVACFLDAKMFYNDLNVSYTVVLSIVNEPRAAYPYYNTLERRKKSFFKWPPCMPFSPEEMSEAGFYYSGMHDQVICFCCGRGLYKWLPTDNPWEEHKKHSPDCYYLKTHTTAFRRRSDN